MPRWCPTLKPPFPQTNNESGLTRVMLSSEQGAGRPGPRACRRHGARRQLSAGRRGRAGHQLRARGGGSPAESVTVDAARYVPSSSSKNKRVTASPPPLRRTTAAAAATAFMVGDSCGRRRASAAIVVGDGTSTAARARPWRVLVLGRIVVSATRRAQGTQRIVELIAALRWVVLMNARV